MSAIRAATPADLPSVKAIYDGYVRGSIATFDTEPPPLSTWEEKPGCMYVAAEPDIVGFAYAAPYRARAAYDKTVETTIYLTPSAAGRGIGRRLYDTLLTRLVADRLHTAVAVIALPNPASVALHEACGFARTGVLREVGHKFESYVDTAFYQLMLEQEHGNRSSSRGVGLT
jgi:L-amino acid N-acyltransferase YncA